MNEKRNSFFPSGPLIENSPLLSVMVAMVDPTTRMPTPTIGSLFSSIILPVTFRSFACWAETGTAQANHVKHNMMHIADNRRLKPLYFIVIHG
jgi:hypothetical protein